MVVETADGLALKLLGPARPEERFLDLYLFAGKESWSTRGGKTSSVPLEEKDRDCGRISHDVMWW